MEGRDGETHVGDERAPTPCIVQLCRDGIAKSEVGFQQISFKNGSEATLLV